MRRDKMSGLLPRTSISPYFTGTGFEADHNLPGAMKQAETIARGLGYSGKLLFVTCAGDDDWVGEHHTQTRITCKRRVQHKTPASAG